MYQALANKSILNLQEVLQQIPSFLVSPNNYFGS